MVLSNAEPGVPAVSYTTVVEEEADTTPEIKTANINGEAYKFDYLSLKHRPVFKDRSEGPAMLESCILQFSPEEVNCC